MTSILIPVLTMGILGFLFSVGLAIAYKKLRVPVDPRVEQIAEALPQVNCGACGFSGCRAFAEAVVGGKASPADCTAAGEETIKTIAGLMGLSAEERVKKAARIHCRGTHDAAPLRSRYLGIKTCYAAHLMGGDKQCSYGCLEHGDCVRACPFGALSMGEDGLPVVREDLCTGCGKACVEACPRNLIEIHPLQQNIIVFCRSLDRGPVARKACKNACIACTICTRACPEAIKLENNLAVITDHTKIDPDKIAEIEKCPTGAIGRLKKENREGLR